MIAFHGNKLLWLHFTLNVRDIYFVIKILYSLFKNKEFLIGNRY